MQTRSPIPFLLTLLSLTLLSLLPLSPPLRAAEPAAASADTGTIAPTQTAPSETATPASVAADGRKSSPTTQQWVKWLPPILPPHEVEWLQENSVFSLYFPQQLAEAKGSVLLIPAAGQHAAWPDHIRALCEQLPANGWSVLVVTSVAAAPAPPPVSAAPADAQPAAAAEPTPVAPAPTEATMLAVLHSGIALLESKGQKNTIVIGMGEGGMSAVELAHKEMGTDGSVKGLVLADLPELARPAQKLSEIFRLHPIMVLDITHPDGRDAQHLRAAQLKQFPQYYAVQLPEPMADIQMSNDRFARRVRGWLTRYVSGEQKTGPQPSGQPAGKP